MASKVSNTTFSNQYVSFTYPNNINITDNSNSTTLDLEFNDNNGTDIGAINSAILSTSNGETNTVSTTIAGKKATNYSDKLTIGSYIYSGNKIMLNLMFFYPETYAGAYNTIKGSIVIKKNPSQGTLNS